MSQGYHLVVMVTVPHSLLPKFPIAPLPQRHVTMYFKIFSHSHPATVKESRNWSSISKTN